MQGVRPNYGLYVINMNIGDTVHWMEIDGVVEELYCVNGETRFTMVYSRWVEDRPNPARNLRLRGARVVSTTVVRG